MNLYQKVAIVFHLVLLLKIERNLSILRITPVLKEGFTSDISSSGGV